MSAPWAKALETLPAVKVYMGLGDGSKDVLLQDIINEVSADCQNRFAKRFFLQATYTDEKYDGDGTRELLLRQWPVTSVTSLVVEDGGSALVQDTDYVLYEADGIIKMVNRTIPTSLQKVVITYVAGYNQVTALPFELRHSIKAAVAWQFRKVDKRATGIVSSSITTPTNTQAVEREATDYPAHVLSVWKHYRKNRSQ